MYTIVYPALCLQPKLSHVFKKLKSLITKFPYISEYHTSDNLVIMKLILK